MPSIAGEDATEAATLRGLYRAFLGGAGLMVLVGSVEIFRGSASVWLAIEALAVLVTAILLHPRWPRAVRANAFVFGASAVACSALVHFGPFLGTGAIFSLPPVGAALFFGRRRALGVAVVIAGVVVATGQLTAAGLFVPSWTSPPLLAWTRFSLTFLLTSAAIVALSERSRLIARRSVELQLVALEAKRAAEAERARFLASVARSQHLESLGRLAGGVAHDVNNALLVIRSNAELLRAHLPPAQCEVVDDVVHAADGASATTRQLLTFSRRAPTADGTCAPGEVLERFASAMRRLLPDSLRVDVRTSPTRHIALPAGLLEQALLNLVLNARDAMPDGGVITLRVGEDGEDVVVEVSDTGLGLDEAARARVFEPFYSTKEEGTGMGLAVVWGTATRAGGTVEVDSREGHGASFRLRLPACAAVTTTQPLATPPRAASRVLLVEDNPAALRTFERVLRRAGHEVCGHVTVEGAMRELEGATFDLLLTDATLPGENVGPLIQAFRRARPGAPVLVCSGHIENDIVLDGIEHAEIAFLPKPFEPGKLEATVAGLLAAAHRPEGSSQGAEKVAPVAERVVLTEPETA